MIIYSKFKDYYDSIARTYYDKSIVYKRFPETNKLVTSRFPGMIYHYFGGVYKFTTKILGFCGKYYLIYSVYDDDKRALSCCQKDKIPAMLNQFGQIDDASRFIKTINTVEKWSHYDAKAFAALKYSVERTNYIEPFFMFNCPAFIYDNGVLITNPCLKDIGFASIVDPYSAFQELSMFIGGVLGMKDSTPITSGDDKIIRDAKGFDDMSFKKVAPGKKTSRANNKLRKNARNN